MKKKYPLVMIIFLIILNYFLFSYEKSKADFQKIQILRKKFQKKIIEISEDLDGVVGVAIKNLKTGETFFLNENIIFPQASSIKIAILYELFKRAENGEINLEDTLKLTKKDKVGGSGVLQFLEQTNFSIKDLAILMIVLSDNTATNLLIDYIGMDKINERLIALGLKNTRLKRKMMDINSAKQGKENISTPYEMMKLLEKIYYESFSWKILQILSLPKDTPLRRGIPYQVRLANKPGGLRAVRCDSGIVLLKDSPYIICVMTTYLKNDIDGEEAITKISRITYEYFYMITKYSEYGRILFK